MSDLVPPMMPDDLDALIQTMERVQQLEAEVARLRLTDEEREAIVTALAFLRGETDEPGVAQDAATLRGLLERTK
jgi:hypothetical protein